MADLTREQFTAVLLARSRMFQSLQAEFPTDAAMLYAVACASGVGDLLKITNIAKEIVEWVNQALADTRYRLIDQIN